MTNQTIKSLLPMVLLAILFLYAPPAMAQNKIQVASFRRMETDVTARVTAPKRDQNGEPCAIIKVVTRDKALFFEPDALGITAREDQPGEIWLYVPHGARRITIKHERLGIIRNYFYTEPIDKSTVYEMVLSVPEVENGIKIVHQENTEQGLMMNYSPAKANYTLTENCKGRMPTVRSASHCPKASTLTG